jgi:NAD(P)-dependent dehydrogenase (short-subunit alcohol dehydrogenase family)
MPALCLKPTYQKSPIAALPFLRKAGSSSIINIASVLGINGYWTWIFTSDR